MIDFIVTEYLEIYSPIEDERGSISVGEVVPAPSPWLCISWISQTISFNEHPDQHHVVLPRCRSYYQESLMYNCRYFGNAF